MRMPAWRNGLARWTSNPKVVGSNPTVGVFCDYSDRYNMKSFAQFTRIVHLFNYDPQRHVRCFRGAIGFPFLPCLTKHDPVVFPWTHKFSNEKVKYLAWQISHYPIKSR